MRSLFLIALFLVELTSLAAPGDRYIRNPNIDADTYLCVNDGGVETCPIVLDGASGTLNALGIGTVPATQLHIKRADDLATDYQIVRLQAGNSGRTWSLGLTDVSGSTDFAVRDNLLGSNVFTLAGNSGNAVFVGDVGIGTTPSTEFHLNGIFSLVVSELTISGGSVTATQSYHQVDTEADAATDDLDNITATNAVAGSILIIRPAVGARTVVAKDGTGNLRLEGDFSMDDDTDTLMLMFTGGSWLEISRSNNI